MQRSFAPKTIIMGALAGLAMGGLVAVVSGSATAARNGDLEEHWINANLVQLKVGGDWEDVPLMPLADHLCASNNDHYNQYCD